MKGEDWRAIGLRISERKRQAKESEVLWNHSAFTPSKVRKEVLRNRKVSRHCPPQSKPELYDYLRNVDHHWMLKIRAETTKLPVGLIIRTPPSSPRRETGIRAPSSTLLPDQNSAILNSSACSIHTHPRDQFIRHIQTAPHLSVAGQHRISMFRHLRENIPFNRFMSEMLGSCTFLVLHEN